MLHYEQNPHVFAHFVLLFSVVQLPLRLAFLHFLVDFTSLHFPTMKISEKEYIYSYKKNILFIYFSYCKGFIDIYLPGSLTTLGPLQTTSLQSMYHFSVVPQSFE